MDEAPGKLVVVGDSHLPPERALGAVAAAIELADDRSDGADDLARRILDEDTRWHLSPQRANALRPFGIGAGDRVLEVGAGTGALSRYLAERGADLVALERSVEQAHAVVARCSGVPVEVVAGSLADYAPLVRDARFDVITLIDVLSPEVAGEALATAAPLLVDGGVLIVAVDNPFSLRRLSGVPDGSQRDWFDDTGRAAGVGALGRRGLAGLLDDVGLPAQRWLLPFPSSAFPEVVIGEHALASADAGGLYDLLVRQAVPSVDDSPLVVSDLSTAYGEVVVGGLGVELASCYLVVAGRHDDAVAARVHERVDAWLFGPPRPRRHRRVRQVERRETGRVVVTVEPLQPEERRGRWLRQHVGGTEPFVLGANLASTCEARCREGDEAGLVTLLRQWADAVPQVDPPGRTAEHPFLDGSTTTWAPGRYLDVDLHNFVLLDGALHFVDDEFEATGPVDRDLVRFRALWHFARGLVTHSVRHPWPLTARVDDLALGLAQRAGVGHDERSLSRFRKAERALQGELSLLSVGELDAYLAPDRSVAGELEERRGSVRSALQRAVEADESSRLAERRAAAADAAAAALLARVEVLDGEVLRLTSEWYMMKAALVTAEQERLAALEGR